MFYCAITVYQQLTLRALFVKYIFMVYKFPPRHRCRYTVIAKYKKNLWLLGLAPQRSACSKKEQLHWSHLYGFHILSDGEMLCPRAREPSYFRPWFGTSSFTHGAHAPFRTRLAVSRLSLCSEMPWNDMDHPSTRYTAILIMMLSARFCLLVCYFMP